MQDMRRLILFCLATLASSVSAFADEAVFLTWNMRWFPSGKADLRRSREIESSRTAKAGATIFRTVMAVGWEENMGIVITAVEMRDAIACSNLLASCKIDGLKVVTVSRFLDTAGYPTWQQIAVISNLPVVESGYIPWQSEKYVTMTRGFTYAVFDCGGKLITCFGLHLKANDANTDDEFYVQRNIYKREYSALQILAKFRDLQQRYGDRIGRVMVAGDFNTDEENELFVSESTLRSFYGAHFRNCFRGMDKSKCITHPGKYGFAGSTLDYILYRGFGEQLSLKIGNGRAISDHSPLAVRLALDV